MTVLNAATKFGDLDLVVQPAGFPTGYEGLAADATVETIAGVVVRVATLVSAAAPRRLSKLRPILM